MIQQENSHELETQPIGNLLVKFSIPCIISLLVSALYNIVDQIFIGQGVGYLGNAATSVAFPLVTIAFAIALMIGDGSGAFFALKIGEKDMKTTGAIVGNCIIMLTVVGVALAAISLIFLKDILTLFGATEAVMQYAVDYTGIIAIGIPFAIFSTGFNSVIRSDGNPKFSMISMLIGAIVNTILDPIFIFYFGLGVKGAAYATVLGQLCSAILALYYLKKFRNLTFNKSLIKFDKTIALTILKFGISSFITQMSIAIVAICTNKVLTNYGANSVYGSEIPLSIFGIVTKVNQIMLSILLGVAVGAQPILGFNYGAKNMKRVKQTVKIAIISGLIISAVGLVCFQVFPQQIVNIFGSGDILYNEFGVMYFRIFLACCMLNSVQTISTIFFQAIGQPLHAGLLSLSRQIIFYLPAVFLLPIFMGIKGALFAGPLADSLAFILAVILMRIKMKKIHIA
ncbi:MAG: MATE family efflux transporter [Anaerocolumna sp.]